MTSQTTDLSGKNVVITGASSGIGEQAVRSFAARGATLAIGARRTDRLETIRDELATDGGAIVTASLDVTDPSSVTAFAKTVEAQLGGVDVLIANAGTAGLGTVAELTLERWERTIATNLTGVFLTCQAMLPLMTDRDGVRDILIVASTVATTGVPGSSAYAASKWGVRGFAQCLALEVADQGVRVTTVMPGYVRTPWTDRHPRADEMVRPDELAELMIQLATLPASMHVDELPVWPRAMYTE